MRSRFRLFIRLPKTAPSAGNPTLFQYLSVIFWRYGIIGTSSCLAAVLVSPVLPSTTFLSTCHWSLYVPLAVIAILPIEPLELADCKPCEASRGECRRCPLSETGCFRFEAFRSWTR